MDNPTRSERSRSTAIQAALVIITRDGPGALTFDALARESGISKGGLLHQFRTKSGILKALLEYQREYFENFARNYAANQGASAQHPALLSQIAVARESTNQPHSLARAVLAALVEDPNLLDALREADSEKFDKIRAEAADPELALLRLAAARGLAFYALLGLLPLQEAQLDSLFERLLDDDRWQSAEAANTAGTSRPRR